MDLLVSYSWRHFGPAKNEIIRLLHQFGDANPQVERTSVWGIAIVHTSLDTRQVIGLCKQRLDNDPGDIQWAVKWLPVDYWCDTGLDSIKQVIDQNIKNQLSPVTSWAMTVKKRRWQVYHTIDIVKYLTEDMDGKVNLNNPDKIIWVDVIGKKTAVSLLTPEDIFSLKLPHLS